MGKKYICPDCRDATDIPPEHETSIVLVNSGGVHRHTICSHHNTELKYECDVKTEWNDDLDSDADDYKIAE